MPKMKSKRAAKKRFSLTASGKVKYKQMNKGHIMTKKSQKRVRRLKKSAILSEADSMKMRKQLLWSARPFRSINRT